MMTREAFDELLDRSALPARTAAQADLDAMAADARRHTPRVFRPKVLITAGLAAVLATSGASLAAATGQFSWAPWAQEPIGAVTFTMDVGFSCELRFSEYTGGADPGYVAEVNRILRDWYRSADVRTAVEAIVPEKLDEVDGLELQPGETLETLPPGEATNREWARQWTAWDAAVNDAEWDELNAHGISGGDPRMNGSERNGQINCFDEDNAPYSFGSGS
ncbi:hypothetical protein [uncultured Plantibacter sp.]|uniref:hypothetical protein n=1 Tax=uncultured Plantibacter sp. TaxID=293337 RepID=UPI0028D5B514|nr:hypothetical protein [uncultured Plantibacter sp.]